MILIKPRKDNIPLIISSSMLTIISCKQSLQEEYGPHEKNRAQGYQNLLIKKI